MSERQSLERILAQAGEQEREYDWLGAVESYKKAVGLVSKRDLSRMGKTYERLGYAFYRAARQAESVSEFRKRCNKAVKSYEKAKESYGRLNEPGKTPRMLRCDAMIAHLGYWLASEVLEKKRLIDECWRLTKEALKAFEEAGDAWEYGKTYNQLSTSTIPGSFLQWDFQARKKTTKEAAEYGEQAISFLSTFRDIPELARAYVKTASALQQFGFGFLDPSERKRPYQKALGYWLKANELSEETALIESMNSAGMATVENSEWGWGTENAVKNFRRALEYSRKTKDRLIVGWALDWLDFHTIFMAEVSEDPDEALELYKKALQYAEDAKQQYSQISYKSPLWGSFWVEAPYTWYYWVLATYETNLKKRRNLLEKAKEAASDQLKQAEDSGYPEVIMYTHHFFSRILFSLAKIEMNFNEKKRLLEKALEHRNENIKLLEKVLPFYYWKRGRMQAFLADIKSDLVDLAKNSEDKKNMLQEALLDKENSLKLGLKYLAFWEGKGAAPSLFADLGGWQYGYGGLLNRLYKFTNNSEQLRKAIEAFEDAAESFRKVGLMSNMAECHWKAAQTYDTLGEHLKAAEDFDLASNNYKGAAEKIPQLKTFYQDHASYMQAWTEIEKAKHYHRRQEYGIAKEHFEKAANIHKSLKQWSYLGPNYYAWVQVEHAEDLSRKEQSEKSIQTFKQAAKLFNETKKSLQTQLSKIESPEEKEMATHIVNATDFRHEYCRARVALEEAKILDKKGDHTASSEKYGSAVETFEKLAQALESEPEQKEIRYITSFSRAWQKMTRAEAETSPILYIEASQLFEEAKELSPNEKAKTLALGHSRFCRALEAGTKFADTRDTTMHATAIRHLESAANYYVKAGFQSASEYAKATGLLFDAYAYMDNAVKENDPEKKAKLYMMAERVLQVSADSYMKAGHSGKMEQVLRILETVKQKRELAISLTEVLYAPPIVSTTTFPTPTPTSEKAVGLEKFEHADVRANIITRRKDLKVGENLDLEIELVNAGKSPALLVKVEELIPEGFDLIEKPEVYRVEDHYLNMKGRRLDPLRAEEVKMVLRPLNKGVFPLKPRILYLDETGKYKSHEPEPVTITVKELGIKGWLRGPR